MKRFFSRFANWGVYVVLSLIIVGLVVASMLMIHYLKQEEINRMDLFAEAQRLLSDDTVQDPQVQLLLLEILNENHSIPVVVTDNDMNPVLMKNISEEIQEDAAKSKKLVQKMSADYPPIEVELPNGDNQFIYYTNSRMLYYLTFYPWALGLGILGYLLFSYWFLNTNRRSAEGFLWAGLAKETAHQIGTPLSSLIGWLEILKLNNAESEGLEEMEQDVQRLTTISQRFSKLGSTPDLKDLDLRETVTENYHYLKGRISNKVDFTLRVGSGSYQVPHNSILISWVIENLVKNAVDAMKGKGSLVLSLCEKPKVIYIELKDSGSGMTMGQARKIFRPGYSSKERGWGLGLSLARRAVKEYHHGDIRVLTSEVGKGTTFRITLKKDLNKK